LVAPGRLARRTTSQSLRRPEQKISERRVPMMRPMKRRLEEG
jgi:hypothetical protein